MEIITSNNNYLVKDIKKLLKKSSYRKEKSLYVVEGERGVFDIDYNLIEKIILSESYVNNNKKISNNKLVVVSDKIFSSITNTKTPQGIMALVKFKKINLDCLINNSKFILILDNVADPGNLGTIIRTSEAAGVEIIFKIGGCDLYSPKVVRASMSSISRMNIFDIDISYIDIIKKLGYNLIGARLGGENYREIIDIDKIALVVGNEANGISKDLLCKLDKSIEIDMSGSIESLNVSIATAILLYHFKEYK